MSDADDDPTTVTVEPVDDPEQFIQSRRLRDIFDARSEVRDQRQKAKEYQINAAGHNNESTHRTKALRLYRAAVENYLSELRPFLLSDDLGTQYWHEFDFGHITAEPPIYRDSFGAGPETWVYYDEQKDKKYSLNRKPDSEEVDLTGFKCLFELPDPLVIDFNLSVKRPGFRRGGTTTKTATTRHNVPFRKLDAVMNEANMYLQERGIELESNDTDEWEI
jgi:hypothetical protein